MAFSCRVAALIAATVGTVVIAAGPAEAATAFTVKGTEMDHPAPSPEQLLPALFANDSVTRIDYPAKTLGMDASIAVATAGIVNAVQNTVGPVVVAGFSQGAVAVAHAKRVFMSLPSRPSPANLTFITIGDPSGPGGILGVLPFRVPILDLSPITAPDTPYDSVVVNGEYDGWADFPDRPWNVVSVVNALLGIPYVHGRYETVPGGLDISSVPASNITTTINSLGGRTTTYLLPTAHLPLVQPLRDIGIPESIVAAIEKPLRAVVDAGYIRNDVSPAPGAVAPPLATGASPRPATVVPARVPAVTPPLATAMTAPPASVVTTPPVPIAAPPPSVAAPSAAVGVASPPTATPEPPRGTVDEPSRHTRRASPAAAVGSAGDSPALGRDRAAKAGSRQVHSARRPAA